MVLTALLAILALGALSHPAAGQDVERLHREACEVGDLPSCNVLGLIYETGAAGTRDLQRAIGLYERTCDAGVTVGCIRLERALRGDVVVDLAEGFVRVGHVADADTGEPIPGAIVAVPQLQIRVIADQSGRVELGPLPGGRYPVTAHRGDYDLVTGELPVPWDEDFLMLLERRSVDDTPTVGRIFGQITEEAGGAGLADVDIVLAGPTPVRAVSNGEGRFAVEGLEPGTFEVRFVRLGYAPRTATLVVEAGETVEVYASMSAQPIELAPIEVTVGSRYLQRTGFYRRAGSAHGITFTRRDIERIAPILVSELMWRAPGVSVQSGPRGGRIVTRRGSVGDGGVCRLRTFLDGAPVNDWDPDYVRPDDLEAVEVYQGPGVPIEYRNLVEPDGTFTCGVVLVWTRRD